MRVDFVVREVLTGLRRNVTMTIAMILTTAISLGLVGTGLLAVRTIDRTEELYSSRVEVRVTLTQDVSSADADCSQPICAGLKQTLENSPLVASVTFENQQQAYENYKRLFAGQALADLLRRMLSGEYDLAAMGRRARDKSVADFGLDRFVSGTERVYRQVAGAATGT